MSDRVAAGYLRAALQRPPSWTRPEAHRPTPSRVWLAPLSGAVGACLGPGWRQSRITLEAPSDHPGVRQGRSLWTIAPVVQEGAVSDPLPDTPLDGICARALQTIVTDGGANDHLPADNPEPKRRRDS
jgi:hypothetical protein